ncbi:unnamed protein product [Auanema sp. JU1783]|nr:unnamed protein product [Auanema sp. JU1783]
MDSGLPNKGILRKWTNYIAGWQDRYFEISNGTISYYKEKEDKAYGCRGSVSLRGITIVEHEYDQSAFSLTAGTTHWFLKCESVDEKLTWIRLLKDFSKDSNDSDYSSTSTKSHSRNPSSISSVLVRDSLEDNEKLFSSRIAELEAYRTMCLDQMVSVQRLLEKEIAVPKADLLSIKATHIAMINNINHIIDLAKTGKVSISETGENSNVSTSSSYSLSRIADDGEESESTIQEPASTSLSTIDVTSEGDDEWHDADEHSSMGSIERAEEARGSKTPSPANSSPTKEKLKKTKSVDTRRNLPFGHYDDLCIPDHHPLFSDVDTLALEQLKYALAGVEDNIWTLFAEDGAMKMYTREMQDEGGVPIDPLKAVHEVKGVTALEYMYHFYDPMFKKTWDHTLTDMSVVENISRDTVVLHQKHKTVWPAAPRESLFVSHIRRVDSMKREGAHDLYIVCNKDVDREDVPLGTPSSLRVSLSVSMICETVILGNKKLEDITRNDIQCNIIYVSQVHPGGWLPLAALRRVYKKEYPKFLRTFTEFVVKSVKHQKIAI